MTFDVNEWKLLNHLMLAFDPSSCRKALRKVQLILAARVQRKPRNHLVFLETIYNVKFSLGATNLEKIPFIDTP